MPLARPWSEQQNHARVGCRAHLVALLGVEVRDEAAAARHCPAVLLDLDLAGCHHHPSPVVNLVLLEPLSSEQADRDHAADAMTADGGIFGGSNWLPRSIDTSVTPEPATRQEQGVLRAQVERTIEVIRPALQADGGDIILHGVDEDTGVVRVELIGACVGCPASTQTLKAGIERIMRDRIDGVTEVIDVA